MKLELCVCNAENTTSENTVEVNQVKDQTTDIFNLLSINGIDLSRMELEFGRIDPEFGRMNMEFGSPNAPTTLTRRYSARQAQKRKRNQGQLEPVEESEERGSVFVPTPVSPILDDVCITSPPSESSSPTTAGTSAPPVKGLFPDGN